MNWKDFYALAIENKNYSWSHMSAWIYYLKFFQGFHTWALASFLTSILWSVLRRKLKKNIPIDNQSFFFWGALFSKVILSSCFPRATPTKPLNSGRPHILTPKLAGSQAYSSPGGSELCQSSSSSPVFSFLPQVSWVLHSLLSNVWEQFHLYFSLFNCFS